jgi:type IV secretory pathway TrbD component
MITVLKYVALVILGLISGINAILIFVLPDWYNIFFGIILASSIPFYAAMVAIFGNE